MISLIKATIYKYKSFSKEQKIDFDERVTTLVGMNESGKTAFLEALAKVNYFREDPKFKFDEIQDYPRKELKSHQKEGDENLSIKCKFKISHQLLERIQDDIGEKTFNCEEFELQVKYNNGKIYSGISASEKEYIKFSLGRYTFEKELSEQLSSLKSLDDVTPLIEKIEDPNAKKSLAEIVEKITKNCLPWNNKVEGYIVKTLDKSKFT